MYYEMLSIKNGAYKVDDSYTQAHKIIKRHYRQWVKTFKRALYNAHTALNIMKFTRGHEHVKR